MSQFTVPANPVELASIRSEEATSQGFEMTPGDSRLLAELDFAAQELSFIDQSYFLQAHRAMVVPASFEADEAVRYINFMGVTMEGSFRTYSKVHIGRLIGGGAVRAVCMTFTNVTLLPYFDTIPESDLLHVPVLAVKEISKS